MSIDQASPTVRSFMLFMISLSLSLHPFLETETNHAKEQETKRLVKELEYARRLALVSTVRPDEQLFTLLPTMTAAASSTIGSSGPSVYASLQQLRNSAEKEIRDDKLEGFY